tara:strand:- start:8131 stop:9117 length:987 start_codon:yes stop_codon:yes gene_type:complete
MIKWFKKNLAAFSLAMSKVEKNTLTQDGLSLDVGEREEQSYKKGTLEYALVKGEVTQEVKDLRWRMYKMIESSEGLTTKIIGYDDDGLPITETVKTSKSADRRKLKKIKVDSEDKYPLEMVQSNLPIVMSTTEAGLNGNMTGYTDEEIITKTNTSKKHTDSNYELEGTTLGEINNDDYNSFIKSERPIKIGRKFKPKFEIENFTKKVNVRTIDDENKLLEFYISVYPDNYDRKTNLLLSEIKRAIKNPRLTSILDIDKINFITYKTMGSKDFYEYEYDVLSFDKIVEFDGFYVIKFKCKATLNGRYLLEDYREVELDKKYENKERKTK